MYRNSGDLWPPPSASVWTSAAVKLSLTPWTLFLLLFSTRIHIPVLHESSVKASMKREMKHQTYPATSMRQRPPNAAALSNFQKSWQILSLIIITWSCKGCINRDAVSCTSNLKWAGEQEIPGIYLGSSCALKTLVEIRPDALAMATLWR